MKLRTITLLIAAAWLLPGCAKSNPTREANAVEPNAPSPEEAQAIAKEAYIYAYPMLENYRTMYVQAIDKTAPGYTGAFNELSHNSRLLGPEFKDIVRPNNDTLYSFAWLDLRAQPLVVTVPEIENRYYSIQLVDMFTHNLGYIGTRATGKERGSYVVAGPQWKGPKPESAKAVFRSESDFVYCIIRTEVRGPKDIDSVRALQRSYGLTPLHVFLGHSRMPAASGITFPAYQAEKAQSAAFIDLLGFLLEHVSVSEEAELMERFARIGIRPGATAASLSLDPRTRDAVEAGIGRALVAIREAAGDVGDLQGVRVRVEQGWRGIDGLFGPGEEMRGKYLVRAAAAMLGLYGNDTVEAYYPMADQDAGGERLDGAEHDYVIRFEAGELPQVEAFWSLTMYSLPEQLMVENPIDRYSIGDRSDLRYARDGSLTIYVQQESPGPERRQNWLPAPAGPFSLQLRMYLPKPEALDPLYLPPGVEVAR